MLLFFNLRSHIFVDLHEIIPSLLGTGARLLDLDLLLSWSLFNDLHNFTLEGNNTQPRQLSLHERQVPHSLRQLPGFRLVLLWDHRQLFSKEPYLKVQLPLSIAWSSQSCDYRFHSLLLLHPVLPQAITQLRVEIRYPLRISKGVNRAKSLTIVCYKSGWWRFSRIALCSSCRSGSPFSRCSRKYSIRNLMQNDDP